MAEIRLDSYVFDVLMRDLSGHDRKASAFLVYLFFWAKTVGAGRRSARASLRQIAEGTGLSKSAVQSALKILQRRKLLRAERKAPTAVPEYFLYRPWAGRRPAGP